MDEIEKVSKDPELNTIEPQESAEIAKEERVSTVIQVTTNIDPVEIVGKDDTENPVSTESKQEVNLNEYIDNMVQERLGELKQVEQEVEEEVSKVGVTVSNEKIRNDPYAGYLRPNGQSKRRRMKKKRSYAEEAESMDFLPDDTPVKEHNGVVVSYSEKTMPADMKKYVTHTLKI